MAINLIDKIAAKNDAFRILLDFIGLGKGSVSEKSTPVVADTIMGFDSENSDEPNQGRTKQPNCGRDGNYLVIW